MVLYGKSVELHLLEWPVKLLRHRGWDRDRKWREKSLAISRIWTHDILFTRCSLHQSATTAALSAWQAFLAISFSVRLQDGMSSQTMTMAFLSRAICVIRNGSIQLRWVCSFLTNKRSATNRVDPSKSKRPNQIQKGRTGCKTKQNLGWKVTGLNLCAGKHFPLWNFHSNLLYTSDNLCTLYQFMIKMFCLTYALYLRDETWGQFIKRSTTIVVANFKITISSLQPSNKSLLIVLHAHTGSFLGKPYLAH